MKTFKIYETKPATQTWIYEVEAENEEQAIEMIENGDVEAIDFGYDCELSEDSDFEIEEIED